MFKNLFTGLVRSHFEYAYQIWSIYKSKDIKSIENVHRRATKLIPTPKILTCEERLRKIDLPTLVYGKAKGDIIETYKILNGIYDTKIDKFLHLHHGYEKKKRPLHLVQPSTFSHRKHLMASKLT